MSLEYTITSEQVDRRVGTAHTKRAQIVFDTSRDAIEHLMNPAELLLSAFDACMLRNVERYAKSLPFAYQKTVVRVHGIRQDVPPRIARIDYELTIWTAEPAHRVALLHRNLQQFGTIYNTLAESCEVTGTIQAETPTET